MHINWVNSERISAHVKTNQNTCCAGCDIMCYLPCSHISCGYPKRCGWFMFISITMHVQRHVHIGIKIFFLRSYRYVRITNKAWCACSIKAWRSRWRQNEDIVHSSIFYSSKFSQPYSSKFSTVKILCHTVQTLSEIHINLHVAMYTCCS